MMRKAMHEKSATYIPGDSLINVSRAMAQVDDSTPKGKSAGATSGKADDSAPKAKVSGATSTKVGTAAGSLCFGSRSPSAAKASAPPSLGNDPMAVPPGLGVQTRRRESAAKDPSAVGEPVRGGGGSSCSAASAGVGAKRRVGDHQVGRSPSGGGTAAVRGTSQQKRPERNNSPALQGLASPVQFEASVRPPPGLSSTAAASEAVLAPKFAEPAPEQYEASDDTPADSGSYDEEVDLLRCEADLVEAAREIDTTSADDDMLFTDADMFSNDDEDGLAALPGHGRRLWQLRSQSSVVIEDDEEDISSGMDEFQSGFMVDSTEMRSRLWAQSLLRLQRSIDEIYSLCEFESDESLCQQVRSILDTASNDFTTLEGQFDTQQEYALLTGSFPFKAGVAWTTRTPRATRSSGDSALELLERHQQTSPSGSYRIGSISKTLRASIKVGEKAVKRRSRSLDQSNHRTVIDEDAANEAAGGGTGEASGSKAAADVGSLRENREEQLQMMVQSTLHNVNSRLGRASRSSPEELMKKNEDRHRRAQQLRASQDDQRLQNVKQLQERIDAAKERRQEKEQRMERDLLEKMTRARRQYQDQLRIISNRARKENRRAAEVAYLNKEGLQSEREILKRKQENAQLSRMLMREQMRKKLLDSASRVAKVSENRRRQIESWQIKVQQELEEKERKALQRRQDHIGAKIQKSQDQENRSEMVREKREELQEQVERGANEMIGAGEEHLGRKLAQLSCCDTLPDGVREEVAEQLRTSRPIISPSGNRRTKNTPVASKGRGQAQASAGGGTSSSHASTSAARPGTPPPSQSCYSLSPKGSPSAASANAEISDSAQEDLIGDALSPPDTPLQMLSGDIDCDASPEVGTSQRCAVDEVGTRKASAKPRAGQTRYGRGAGRVSVGTSPVAVSSSAAKAVGTQTATASAKLDEEAAEAVDSSASDCADAEDADFVPDVIPELPSFMGGDGANSTANATDAKEKAPRAKGKARHASKRVVATASGDAEPGSQRHDEELNHYLATFRGQLESAALTDEEALKLVCDAQGGSAVAVNAAQRARISKLATDLGKVISADDSSAQSINLDRADVVLADFCKVLTQSQREADFALILKLGCVGKVIDICTSIKNSMSRTSQSAKQMSAVMLSALKWIGLLSKQKISRVYLLLTNRVVPLADVAIACLDANAAGAGRDDSKSSDTQSISILFLPQVLHVLSLHVKQSLPDSGASLQRSLISYLLVCGLPEKLRDLFRRAEVRGMKIFDAGASPVPLLLLRAMGFLGTLVGAYVPLQQAAAAVSSGDTGDRKSVV